MAERVTAEAILRARDGTSVAGAIAAPTSDDVDRYLVDDEVVAEATRMLHERGIEVLQRGAVSLSISADKDVFERVFRSSLERVEGMGGRYRAITPPRVPGEMSSVIAEVVLPMKPTFYL